MRSTKKTAAAKTSRTRARGKRIGLTSAIGPKATTALVIVTLAGGLWYGSHQRLAAKTKTASLAADTRSEMAADPAAAPTTSTGTKTHDNTATAPVSLEASAAAKPPKAPVSTLEGCLERSGETFRLKDTSGADAPKARSWKSGFLRRGPATVDVLDAGDSLGLANRVGTRVRISGPMIDRQMQARTIHRVASSCS